MLFQTSDSSPPSDRTSKKSTPESSRTTPIEPLRIKVEDEDYFPDNEGVATPDSSQPSPKSKIRRTKGLDFRSLYSFMVTFLTSLWCHFSTIYCTLLMT